MKRIDLTNERFGKWQALSYAGNGRWNCVCECGSEKAVRGCHLVGGNSKSCGCSWTTHGMANSKEYMVWDSMIRRCHNANHKAYSSYGARGITVCPEWRSFSGFFADMGHQPKGLTLERIDNSKGYAKDNCKWATITEQARNRRSTKLSMEKVKEVRELLAAGLTQQKVAEHVGVSRSNIGHVAQKTTWRHQP